MVSPYQRRTFLKAASVTGAVGLAGCTQLTGGGGGEYPSEDIRFIVPYGEGSGFDTYIRGLAPVWENQFEGNVNITVENITGGGGRRGTETLYNADPDGYTVGVINVPGFAISQVLLDVDYDLRELTQLGRIVRATYILQTGGDSDVEQWKDLQERDQVPWGITGVGSTSSFTSILTANAADINLEFVSGYDGGTDVLRATQQGEVLVSLYTGSTSRPFIEDDRTKPLLQYTSEPLEWLSDVPLTEDTDVFEGYEDLNLSRIVSAPPDLEDSVAETLRTTLWDALQSEEFQEWAEGADRSLNNRAQGDEAAGVVESAFETAQANQDVLSQYVDQ